MDKYDVSIIVAVYNNEKYIGRYKIKNNTIDISNSVNKFYTNNYLLKFNNRLYKKYKGKNIKIVKGDLSKYCQITSDNVEVRF